MSVLDMGHRLKTWMAMRGMMMMKVYILRFVLGDLTDDSDLPT
jgi:hypothetical protein